jgi:hypothetical protein
MSSGYRGWRMLRREVERKAVEAEMEPEQSHEEVEADG